MSSRDQKKQKAVDNEEESESLRDLEGKPVGKTTKLAERVFQVFQLRDSFQRGRRCMLCDDVIEDDLLVGEGEVFDCVFPSAAVVGSAAFPLSGVVLTVDAMASSFDKDEDRRSVREAREEAMAKEGVPDAKETKKKRRRREKKGEKTPGSESKVKESKEDEMEEIEVEEPPKSSKPPVRSPPVEPPKVKKDHLKDKGKKGKGKGEKGKGKDKGKGKKGKGKAEVASPSKPSRPKEPPTPPPGHAAVEGSKSRNVLAGMGASPAKPKLDLPGSGFTKSATHRLRCDFCRKRGHIARFCPAVDFRISLTDSSVRPHKREDKPPPQPEEEGEEDVAVHLKERREVRRELRQRAREAKEAMEEADRKMKEAKGQPHPVTPEEQKVLDRQKQDKKDLSSYSYYTSSEDAPGEGVRLVPKAEVKEDPKDPSSSESSSDDDDEGEEEEREDPDEEGSEQSELFEAEGKFTSNVAAGAAGKSSKKLPVKPAEVKPETKLADDQEEMKRLEEASRALEQEEEENRQERKRLQKELKALRQKRLAENAAAGDAEKERAKKKKADDEAAARRKAEEEAEAQRVADEEEAQRIAREEEVKKTAEELQKAVETAYQLQRDANKAGRKAQRAAEKAEREPEESAQKAKESQEG